jgi:hypothetical protein
VAPFLQTFKDYPPSQRPASFSIDQMVEGLMKAITEQSSNPDYRNPGELRRNGRIRYTSVSVPYHIGNGWGGGLVPFITSAAFAATGSTRCSIRSSSLRCVSSLASG